MRRPPKEKKSAASARSSSGASNETPPSFSIISRIAPLPPNLPYRITVGGRVQPIDPASASHAEKEFLDLGNEDEFLDVVKKLEGAEPKPIERNPFDSDCNDSDGRLTVKQPACGGEAVSREATTPSETASKDGHGKEYPPDISHSASLEQQFLSESDLRYLANQNQYLLMYAAQNEEDEKSLSTTTSSAAPYRSPT